MTNKPTYEDLEQKIIRLESALKEHQQDLKQHKFNEKITENLTQGVILVKKTDDCIAYVDSQFNKMFGYSNDELIGKHVSILNAPGKLTAAETSTRILTSLEDKGSWRGRIENIKKDGSKFWSKVNIASFDSIQFGETWISTHEDITNYIIIENELLRYQTNLQSIIREKTCELEETNLKLQKEIETRDQIEAELRLSEHQIKLALEGTEQGIWLWDSTKGLHTPDRKFFEILGYKPQEVDFSLDWWEKNLHPESIPEYKKVFNDHVTGKSAYFELEYRLKSKAGEWHWFWNLGMIMEYNDDGSPCKMLGTNRHISDQKRAETKLKETNEHYNALFERSRDAVYVCDFEGNFIDANRAALELTGYQKNEIQSLSFANLLDEKQLETALKAAQEVIDTGSQENFTEFIFNNKDGDLVWVEAKGSLLYKNGKPYAIQGIARNVTERKLTEENTRNTNSLLTSLIESPSDINIFAIDRAYRYTAFNQAFVNEMLVITGNSVSVGKNILDHRLPKATINAIKQNFEEVFQGKWLTKIEEFRSGGENIWYQSSYNPIFDEEKNVIGATVYVSNITEQMKTQEELHQQEQIFRALAENSPDIIIRLNTNLKFVYVNPAFEIATGIPIGDFIDKSSNELPLDTLAFEILEHHVQSVISSGKSVTTEFYFKTKTGKVYYQVRIVPEVDSNEVVEYILCSFRDITGLKNAESSLQFAHAQLEKRVAERTNQLTLANLHLKQEIANRKEMENKLIYAKMQADIANKAKSEFLANISHELRTPMHHILNYSKFGIEKLDKPKEKLGHYFAQIRKTSVRLMFLLNELLDLSKLESGKMDYTMEKYDLIAIIEDSAEELSSIAQEKGVTIELPENTGASLVTCDIYKIGQVVRNLLSNSIKFTAPGKHIAVSVSDGILTNEKGKIAAIKVSVIDQGIGIPSDEIKLVFEKFVQGSLTKTGAGGTGLGLAICQRIIEDHNGRIWAAQNPEGGAIFNFLIPYAQELVE